MSRLLIVRILLAVAMAGPVLISPGIAAPAAAAPSGPMDVRVNGDVFAGPGGQDFFVIGVNYEGHTDRAWHMWENGLYDPSLIEADLAKAAQGGFNTVRIFVQRPLRDDIDRGDFGKLDTVVQIAREKGLYLILTLYDYEDKNLEAVASVAKKVASRYAGEKTLLGYDIKNEPQFGTIALATYPSGLDIPLQTGALIKQYGEKMSRAQTAVWRTSGEGKGLVPRELGDEQAYFYANNYLIYKEFLAAAEAWVAKNNGKSTLDYMDSPDSSQWQGFLGALDRTLSAWISVQLSAIRSVDLSHPVTLSYSNMILAKLPANGQLDFHSPHRFSQLGGSSLSYGFRLLENLRRTFPGQPIVLSEFGYSNASGSLGSEVMVDQHTTAIHEAATWLYLYQNGFAGGGKWMLNNYSAGYSPRENNFGILDDQGNPKVGYYGTTAISRYIADRGFAGRGALSVTTGSSTSIDYLFEGDSAVFGTSGRLVPSDGGKIFVQPGAGDDGQVFVWWGGFPEAGLSLLATRPARVTLDLRRIIAGWDDRRKVLLHSDSGAAEAPKTSSGTVTLDVDPNQVLQISFGRPAAFEPAQAMDGDSSVFFPETSHNLAYGFKYYWENNGGLGLFGYPISEEFTENGYTVQYFERARFEYHPELKGTPYEVQLGLLGSLLTRGRHFDSSPAFQSTSDRRYHPETGHSLSYGFKYYWEQNGGLPIFGYPISEEFQETNPADGKSYTVQYFERARFEYHPEHKGTPYEVELGHLGKQWAVQKGWAGW